ncbi:MAG: MFS transporter [Actinomycetota bacterium]|nr:MFS transporter [Actinomycetota bacterium]
MTLDELSGERVSRPRVPGSRWPMGVALVAAVFGSMPAFLTGIMAVLLRADLGFGERGLGAAISIFFAAAAIGSVPAGHLVERIGARAGLLIGAAGTTATLAGIGLLANSWGQLVLWLVLGGAALAFTQPASNLALTRGIRFRRLGLAFGLKQGAIPAATMLGGAALPLIGLTLGWRWAFGGMAVLTSTYLLALLLRRLPPGQPAAAAPHGDAAAKHVLVLAVSGALGMAAGNSLGSFFVEFAVSSGIAVGAAGVWLVVGSIGSILARVLWGWFADRRDGRNLAFIMALMGIGAASFVVLALSPWPALLAASTFVAFATAWGWPGLMLYTVVRLRRETPAASTGVVLAGTFVGGAVGPVLFGTLVEQVSYQVAWLTAALLLVLAAGCAWIARRLLLTDLAHRRATPEFG